MSTLSRRAFLRTVAIGACAMVAAPLLESTSPATEVAKSKTIGETRFPYLYKNLVTPNAKDAVDLVVAHSAEYAATFSMLSFRDRAYKLEERDALAPWHAIHGLFRLIGFTGISMAAIFIHRYYSKKTSEIKKNNHLSYMYPCSVFWAGLGAFSDVRSTSLFLLDGARHKEIVPRLPNFEKLPAELRTKLLDYTPAFLEANLSARRHVVSFMNANTRGLLLSALLDTAISNGGFMASWASLQRMCHVAVSPVQLANTTIGFNIIFGSLKLMAGMHNVYGLLGSHFYRSEGQFMDIFADELSRLGEKLK